MKSPAGNAAGALPNKSTQRPKEIFGNSLKAVWTIPRV
jgi:hypothetical protein